MEKVKGYTKQVCTTLLLHAEAMSGGVMGVHVDLTLKVRQLWSYFKMQVIKHGAKDTHMYTVFTSATQRQPYLSRNWMVANKRLFPFPLFDIPEKSLFDRL